MRIASSDVIRPAALDPVARQRFVEALYTVHAQIFDGVDLDTFAHYVVDSPADDTWILVHHDEAGGMVGYFAAHLFRRVVRGRPAVILRGETGMLRAYRGGSANARFGFGEAARIVAENPTAPVYYLGCLVHPTSYYNFAKFVRPLWPSRDAAPDAELVSLMAELGDSFGLARVGENPLVRAVGWRTRDTEAEREAWLRSEKPDVRYFVEANPGYVDGHGLLTLIPMSADVLAGAIGRVTRERGERALEDAWARVLRLPVASRWLMAAEVRRRLRAVPLFDGLDDERLAALAARAEVETLPAGRILVREGERGDDLFVLHSGAVHVHAARHGEELLLAQLDAGDVFGEIGALTGEPRTASARTATRCRLVRLSGQALRDAMGADEALAAAVWSRVAERRFDEASAAFAGLARMTRAERLAFLRRGAHVALEGRLPLPEPGFVYVIDGRMVVEREGARIEAVAPALVEIDGRSRAEASGPARCVVLPHLASPDTVHRDTAQLTTVVGAAWAKAPPPGMEVHRFPAGAVILRDGAPAESVWYLLDGRVRAERDGEVLGRLGPGESFGERAVLLDTPRSAGIVAETDVVAGCVPADAFRRWCEGQPELGALVAALGHVRGTGGGARTASVYRGTHEGEPCVTSVTCDDGRVFTAIKLLDRPVVILSSDEGAGPATTWVDFERASPGTSRRLGHRADRAVSIRLAGDLDAAAACAERLRSGRPLTAGELERFRWTGRLGAPGIGADRLVCGCVGLSHGALAALAASGCDTADAVCERTGAGGVCGGCVPLIRHLLDGGLSAPGRHPDEVDLDMFEARLDSLRHVDGTRSLCGPETMTWRVYGETVALLGGQRALLLQFAHPAAQALAEHSKLTTESAKRLHATLEYMYGLAFGEGTTMLRLAREVFEKHSRVTGRYDATRGPYKAGDRYAANQIDLLLWTAATVTDTSVLTYEALVGPLSLPEKDQLVAEAAELFGLFGVPRSRFPTDWAAFRRYFDGVVDSGVLAVGDHARVLSDALLTAPHVGSDGLYWVLRRLTARWLPEPLRAGFGLEDGPVARATGAALELAIRTAVPRMPRELRICPARLHAERRLAGEAGPDPQAARLERVIAFALGVDPAG